MTRIKLTAEFTNKDLYGKDETTSISLDFNDGESFGYNYVNAFQTILKFQTFGGDPLKDYYIQELMEEGWVLPEKEEDE